MQLCSNLRLLWHCQKKGHHPANKAIQSHTPNTSFIRSLNSHRLDHCPLAMIIPEPGTRPLSAASMHQSLLKLCKLANPQPAYPALLLPLRSEITIKAPAHVCPSLPPPLDCPGSSRMPPCLGAVRVTSWLQRQSPPDLLTSPYLNNNKSYTFKHSDRL